MTTPVRRLGLRTHILLMLLLGAILPLAVVGVWLISSAERSGQALLRTHLDTSADRLVAAIEGRWAYRRADLDLIAGNIATLRLVAGESPTPEEREYLTTLAGALRATVPVFEIHQREGQVVWTSVPASPLAGQRVTGAAASLIVPPTPAIRIEIPIAGASGRSAGRVVASITLSALIPADSTQLLLPGAQLLVRDVATGRLLIPSGPAAEVFPEADVLERRGAPWMSSRRALLIPALQVAIAAPLAPYVAPFRDASRLGLVALAAVVLLALVLTAPWATRVTRPLRELVLASGAVRRGELDRQVHAAGPAEVQQVGEAFNVMTRTLQRSVDELSRRSALAAVGEFATSLSHDVRNSLTAIKLDLERAARAGAGGVPRHDLVRRALNNVTRLENVVSGALQVARRGHAPPGPADLRPAVEAAVETVRGTFAALPARLVYVPPPDPVLLTCDPAAVQQLCANLLFNAAQAMSPGGECTITLTDTDAGAELEVRDSGSGMSEVELARLETPFYSSKPSGSGLGLPIVRQIVAAHGGQLTLQSRAGAGTTVTIRLPRLHGSSHPVERDVTPALSGADLMREANSRQGMELP